MNRMIVAVLAAAALAATAPSARAADGRICYSTLLSMTESGAVTGTRTYPQIGNSTMFYCGINNAYYTLTQLTQMGWSVQVPVPTQYSMTYNTDGSITTRWRYMLVIQK